ncbi:MAG: DUF5050 domain-containing protein [bacterium]|nr:DUF5050 domain-containing protein [bacterium]
MNLQYDYAGGWPLTQNVYAGEGAPGVYGQNVPYGMNQPYGQSMNANPSMPYGMNQPYESSAPFSPGMGQSPVYGMNQPYGQNMNANPSMSYGMNQPYESSAPFLPGMGQSPVYGMNQPYGQNMNANPSMPYGMNQPYESSAPFSPGMGQSPVYGMNQPYGQNMNANPSMSYGMNQPYVQMPPYTGSESYPGNVQIPPYAGNAPYPGNVQIPPYAGNAPYPGNVQMPPYGGNLPYPLYGQNASGTAASYQPPAVYAERQRQQGMIEPYQSRYQLAPIHAKKIEPQPQQQSEQQSGRMVLLGIAGAVIAALLAIMIGILIKDDGTQRSLTEVFASWTEGLFAQEEEEASLPVISFPTQSSGTVRGEMCAVGEDGSIFVRTQYGVCRIGKNGSGYEYNGWAAALPPDVSIRCMAVYGNYLYLACGENGIYRVNTARSNTLSQIIDDYVTSFVIAEDHLFYLSMDYQLEMGNGASFAESMDSLYGWYGELYIAGLNGNGSRSLGETVRHAVKYQSSADFVYLDGYLYFFDKEGNLKRIRTDGTGSRVVVERERQKDSFVCGGVYENGGVLYLPSSEGPEGTGAGLYSYNVETDKLRKVSDARVSLRAPILFAGDTLLYKEYWQSAWHQIKDGQDTIYGSSFNDTGLWMQAIGKNELIVSYEPRGGYYTVSYGNGQIRFETPVSIDYAVMPEVDIEEEQGALAEGTAQGSCRAEHFVFAGPDESSIYDRYVVYPLVWGEAAWGTVENHGLVWEYEDADGGHDTELLVEGEVGAFLIKNDDLYYSMWDEEEESYALFRRCLADHEEETEECLVAAGIPPKGFTWCNGMIYYVDIENGRLYRYHLQSGESERISEDQVGCYDIDNGMIYYEDLSEGSAIYKMCLDGTERERIDTPLSYGEELTQLTVCPYLGEIYLAVTLEEWHRDDRMCLFAEDGSMELFFGEDVRNFDSHQPIYYRDGMLYYSSEIAFEVRVFDFEAYFDGGSGIRGGAYDTVFCEENMNTFAVTDTCVYVQSYADNSYIMVYDRLTGELTGTIDTWDFEGL